jgi:hypothetical protein
VAVDGSGSSFFLLYRIYIDEAGDRGRAPRSSDHFVVSGVVVKDEDDAALRVELDQAKSQIGLSPSHVVHFRKLAHSRKVKVCRDISNFSVACISSVLICKKEPQPFPAPGFRTSRTRTPFICGRSASS